MWRYADSSLSDSESTQPVRINSTLGHSLHYHTLVYFCHYLSGRQDQQCTLRQWNPVQKFTPFSFKIHLTTTFFPSVIKSVKSTFKILPLMLLVCGYSMKYQCGHVTPSLLAFALIRHWGPLEPKWMELKLLAHIRHDMHRNIFLDIKLSPCSVCFLLGNSDAGELPRRKHKTRNIFVYKLLISYCHAEKLQIFEEWTSAKYTSYTKIHFLNCRKHSVCILQILNCNTL
jgi:hypothetical protein